MVGFSRPTDKGDDEARKKATMVWSCDAYDEYVEGPPLSKEDSLRVPEAVEFNERHRQYSQRRRLAEAEQQEARAQLNMAWHVGKNGGRATDGGEDGEEIEDLPDIILIQRGLKRMEEEGDRRRATMSKPPSAARRYVFDEDFHTEEECFGAKGIYRCSPKTYKNRLWLHENRQDLVLGLCLGLLTMRQVKEMIGTGQLYHSNVGIAFTLKPIRTVEEEEIKQ